MFVSTKNALLARLHDVFSKNVAREITPPIPATEARRSCVMCC